jgi:PhnB protein
MKGIQPYLNFDGTTRDAMTFYQQCLGGKLDLQTFADAHQGDSDGVMHAKLESGPLVIMASDRMKEHPFTQGSNVHLNIDCETVEEIDRLFKALGAGGTVTMPLQDTFWGARFGMLTDKYGIQWMFNCELKKG